MSGSVLTQAKPPGQGARTTQFLLVRKLSSENIALNFFFALFILITIGFAGRVYWGPQVYMSVEKEA